MHTTEIRDNKGNNVVNRWCDGYISEEQSPDDFECVWEQELTRTLNFNKDNQPKKIERLFKYKG